MSESTNSARHASIARRAVADRADIGVCFIECNSIGQRIAIDGDTGGACIDRALKLVAALGWMGKRIRTPDALERVYQIRFLAYTGSGKDT